MNKDGQYQETTKFTYCRICESLCGMTAKLDSEGNLVSLRGDKNHPRSEGYICSKGVRMAEINNDPDRVTYPLKRNIHGEYERVSWDEALDDIAKRSKQLVEEHGSDSLGLYIGNPVTFSTNGALKSFGFIKAVGSKQFYTPASQDTYPRQFVSAHLYGSSGRIPFPDIPHTQNILILGANPLVSHGSLISLPRIQDHLDAIVQRGGRVIVIDPMKTKTAKRYEHQFIRPGTDAWLLGAMIRYLSESGKVDSAKVKSQSQGVDELLELLSECTLERASTETGIAVESIVEIADLFAATAPSVAYSRVGLCRGQHSSAAVYLMDMLNLITGNLDRRGGSVFGKAPIDFVKLAGNAYVPDVGEVKTRVHAYPDIGGQLPAHALEEEIRRPGPGQIRGLFVVGGNPVLSVPQGDKLNLAMEKLDLLVAIDIYKNESAQHADYILPSTTALERWDVPLLWANHMPEPWFQYTDPVVQPRGEAREEGEILDGIAARMGLGMASPVKSIRLLAKFGLSLSTRRLIDWMLRSSRFGDHFGFRKEGLSFKRLQDSPHGITYAEDVDENVLADKVLYKDGKIRSVATPLLESVKSLMNENCGDNNSASKKVKAIEEVMEFHLISRREVQSINSWFHNVVPDRYTPTLYISPQDAEKLQLIDGDNVTMSNANGSISVPVEITHVVMTGVVSFPHGYGHELAGWQRANSLKGANVNVLASTNPEQLDPFSFTSWLDGIPVMVSKQRIVTTNSYLRNSNLQLEET